MSQKGNFFAQYLAILGELIFICGFFTNILKNKNKINKANRMERYVIVSWW
jgi:hypothetical protein